jgi:hypothetical protein
MTVSINRQKAGLEDLTFGTSVEQQLRNGELVPVTQINVGNLPLDDTTTVGEVINMLTADGYRVDKVMGAQLTAAATTNIGQTPAGIVHITGATTISSFGVSTTGKIVTIIADTTISIAYNATSMQTIANTTMQLSTGSNATFLCIDGVNGNWKCIAFRPHSLSTTELSYLDGISSNIQTQLNAKAPTDNPGFTTNISLSTDLANAFNMYAAGNVASMRSGINVNASRGTLVAKTAITNGDLTRVDNTLGWDGASYVAGWAQKNAVDGTVSTGIVPQYLAYYTQNQSGSFAERMRLNAAGRLLLNKTTDNGVDQLQVAGSINVSTTNVNAANIVGNNTGAGLVLRNLYGSASTVCNTFLDNYNENAIPLVSDISVFNIDGSAYKATYVTPAGARTSDRRVEAMRVHQNGSLLIGQTNDAGTGKLQVFGNAGFVNGTTEVDLYVGDQNSNGNAYMYGTSASLGLYSPLSGNQLDINKTATGGIIIKTGNSTGTIALKTNNSDRLVCKADGTVTISGALDTSNMIAKAPVTKTANATLTTESDVICNGTATITLTLPAAASYVGRSLRIKTIAAFTVVSASSNVVPLASATAGTAILAATAGKYAELVSDGTNWTIMQAN